LNDFVIGNIHFFISYWFWSFAGTIAHQIPALPTKNIFFNFTEDKFLAYLNNTLLRSRSAVIQYVMERHGK